MIQRQSSRRHRVVREVVVEQRHAGCQHLVPIGHCLERVGILRLELEAVDAQGTVGSDHIGVVYDLTPHRTLQPERVVPKIDDPSKPGVCPVCLGIHEINNWAVGVHEEQVELDVLQASEMCINHDTPALVGKRLEGLTVGNRHHAVNELDSRRGVQRVHPGRITEFGDVVDAVAVEVARFGDEKLIDPVAVCWESRELLGQRRRAGLTQSHRHRDLHRSLAVQLVHHIEHVVLLNRGLDHYRNRPDRNRPRRRTRSRSWTVARRLHRHSRQARPGLPGTGRRR